MDAFDLDQLRTQQQQSGDAYLEFLRTASLSLSAGLYVLAAGATDTQEPHTEDEVYVVLRGRGAILVGEESRAVTTGSIVFEEELTILVLFAPAEYTQGT